jgi:hypothetical protein
LAGLAQNCHNVNEPKNVRAGDKPTQLPFFRFETPAKETRSFGKN